MSGVTARDELGQFGERLGQLARRIGDEDEAGQVVRGQGQAAASGLDGELLGAQQAVSVGAGYDQHEDRPQPLSNRQEVGVIAAEAGGGLEGCDATTSMSRQP